MKVAIIGGSGKMGQWFAEFLSADGKDVIIHGRDKRKLDDAGKRLNISTTTGIPQAVIGADIVLVSVPIYSFEEVIKKLQPCLAQGQTVIDITSVKVMPVEVMHRHLPGIPVLGAHPVFGPGARSARNQNFVLTPTNGAEAEIAERVKKFLDGKGAAVTLMTPQEHDEMMSVILGLSHFIAIASAEVLLSFSTLEKMKEIGGPTYKVLLTLAESVITEDPKLYASIQMNLPGMTEMEDLFRESAKKWADIVRNKDRRGFIERMNRIKERLPNIDPEFGSSYREMYDLLDEK
jgi:prephenate dehydrogenase